MTLKGVEFERAMHRTLEAEGWAVHRAMSNGVNRGGQWFVNLNDVWGCIDLLAIHPTRGLWAIQCTTTAGVSKRRFKVESIAWPQLPGFRVSIAEASARPDDVNRRKTVHFARLHDLSQGTQPCHFAPLALLGDNSKPCAEVPSRVPCEACKSNLERGELGAVWRVAGIHVLHDYGPRPKKPRGGVQAEPEAELREAA